MSEQDTSSIFQRTGNFVRFNQSGVKLEFDVQASDESYYGWLDRMIAELGSIVPGGSIVEKDGARSEPRFNTGVYYDTSDYRLLNSDMVLRTTSNPKTHAFCAFKLGESADGVRKDHRYVFEGVEKLIVQLAPSSRLAVDTVKTLLARRDIEHPGIYLKQVAGIDSTDLHPALCLAQYRRTFYVWLDGLDALRCSLDRVHVLDLRCDSQSAAYSQFSEIEVPIYPRIGPDVAKDPRVRDLIKALSSSLTDTFGVAETTLSKYRRGANSLKIGNFEIEKSR